MTRRPRRALQAAGALLVASVVLLIGAAPASAALSTQYWFKTLDMSQVSKISSGSGVTVAVLDSGVNDNIGDLEGQVLAGTDLSGGGSARSDPGDQCDSAGCFSHGTNMALLIAGTGKGTGFQGLAPGAKILPVKLSSKTGQEFSPDVVANGVRWAVEHGAQVLSMSIGSAGSCDPSEAAAIKYAYQHDVVVVVSAGNEGFSAVSAPADCPGALAITAEQDTHGNSVTLWSGSNYGPEVSFTAAGTNMPQELNTGKIVCCGAGTSGAAALAAATIALIRSHFPSLTARQVITKAIWSTHTGTGHASTGARINDMEGYGEILPYYALTGNVPASFPNKIYDGLVSTLGPATPASPTSGAAPSPSRDGTGTAGSTAPTQGQAPSPVRQSASGSSSNSGVIIGVVVGVIVLALIVVILLVRRRGTRA